MLISKFINDYVYPDVRGCDATNMTSATIDAASDLMTFSGIWNEIQDPVALIDLVQEYDLDGATDARCIDVKAVYAPFACSGQLRALTMPQLVAAHPHWQTEQSSLPSDYTRAFDFTSIRVFPMPTDTNGAQIQIHAVYTLNHDAKTIPDEIFYRYRDAIASGAKARLLSMARVPWQDLKLAAYHSGLFETAKNDARITAAFGNTTGSITVPARRFGR